MVYSSLTVREGNPMTDRAATYLVTADHVPGSGLKQGVLYGEGRFHSYCASSTSSNVSG